MTDEEKKADRAAWTWVSLQCPSGHPISQPEGQKHRKSAYIFAGRWKCSNSECNMNWYWRLSMRDILVRAQIELRETRQITFLCDACNCLTAQDIDALPWPSNPDIEPAEKWHYAVRVSLLEAKCEQKDCEFRVKILAPTGRGMEPNQLCRYFQYWQTKDTIVCARGYKLVIPPNADEVSVSVLYGAGG